MVWRRWPVNVKALIRRVNHTLKLHKLFPEHSRILIACSGGPDSIALLHLLQDIAAHRHTKYKLGIAIVDHSIRPESKAEVLWLRNQVDVLGLSFYTTAFDVPTLSKDLKLSEETVGRRVRYQWLNEIAHSEGYDYIAVAHHKDDQAESILAHLIRGTGLNGLTGMAVVSHDYDIPVIRPLLDVTKEELLA